MRSIILGSGNYSGRFKCNIQTGRACDVQADNLKPAKFVCQVVSGRAYSTYRTRNTARSPATNADTRSFINATPPHSVMCLTFLPVEGFRHIQTSVNGIATKQVF